MPSKKIDWDNVPHINNVTKMDILGKSIQYSNCGVEIKITSQFCFAEWHDLYSTFKDRQL